MSKRSPISRRTDLKLLTDEILTLKSRVAHNMYQIGTRLARVTDEALFKAGGHDTFNDYLEHAVAFSRTTAFELIRIARHFNAEIASRYGFEKLRAVLAYMAATPVEEQPGDIFATDIRVRGPGGRFVTKSLHRASAADIRHAIALLRDAQTASQRVPRRLKTRIERLSAALPPAPKGTSRGDRVRLRRGRDGRLAVTFQAIPLDEVEAFMEVVQEWLTGDPR